mmetsp:Transcript_68665/g.128103  ORF Transcript_68665/g.128103 Transcript_68665/m.128103 type:complete len:378 (-) Transcript_68665:64-1197(-)
MATCAAPQHQRSFESSEAFLRDVARRLWQVDTYRRGLVTETAFKQAMRDLNISRQGPEMEVLQEYCTVTTDGYVHYKQLLQALQGEAPRAKRSIMKDAILPQQQDEACTDLTDQVRQVYARWDRGLLSNPEFREELRGLGYTPTAELDHLLMVHGPGRSLTFSKLMSALQVNVDDGRRARALPSGMQNNLYTEADVGRGLALDTQSVASSARSTVQNDAAKVQGNSQVALPQLREAICGFVDGSMSASQFRTRLRTLGATMPPELDPLIRKHEADNSVRFQDFARVLLQRSDRLPSYAGSVASPAPSPCPTPTDSTRGACRDETGVNGAGRTSPGEAYPPQHLAAGGAHRAQPGRRHYGGTPGSAAAAPFGTSANAG